jgi:FkbM family methyltransferase
MEQRSARYRTWARSLLSPKSRLLPGVGARLGQHPAAAAGVFRLLGRLPTRRLRALAYRHVSLPLVQRTDASIPVRTTGGFVMTAELGTLMGRSLATAGLWEWYLTGVFGRLLGRGDVFVDVGANVGYYALVASRLVGDTGHVYALEPAPETFEKLTELLARNGAANVTALQVAAGAAEGTATLYGTALGHDEMSSLHHERREVEHLVANLPLHGVDPEAVAVATEVPVLPLAEILDPDDLERLRLVKIDVEGYEVEVLRGLEPLFDQGSRPTVVVEVHEVFRPDAPAAVLEFCARYDLRARWVVDDEGEDYDAAPTDRRLELRDLGSPPALDTIPRDRYLLVLEAA